MAGDSKIQWTQKTWNPVAGCSVLSPGCTNCYAMKMAARIEAMAAGSGRTSAYAGLTRKTKAGAVWTGEMRLVESALTQPLRWKKPALIFVNSMSDLFHESVPDAWIDQVFAVMALCPQHTFQVLTKRAERMRDYVTALGMDGSRTTDRMTRAVNSVLLRSGRTWGACGSTGTAITTLSHPFGAREPGMLRQTGDGGVERLVGWDPIDRWMRVHPDFAVRVHDMAHRDEFGWGLKEWPLPNVWLGVSAEDQARADERIPLLLDTPAAVRFLSAEPLLGPIDLRQLERPARIGVDVIDALECDLPPEEDVEWGTAVLDWVIVGGESGPGARPMHPDWARQLRDDCAAAGVPFFFKQWGAWTPGENVGAANPNFGGYYDEDAGRWNFTVFSPAAIEGLHLDDEPVVWSVGKKAAGRLLDGVEHNAMPERAA